MKLPSLRLYQRLRAGLAWQNVKELVIWDLDLVNEEKELLEPKLCLILEKFPALENLEVDVVSVGDSFFGHLERSELKSLLIEEARCSVENLVVTSKHLRKLHMNVYGAAKIKIKDSPRLKLCCVTAPFSQKVSFDGQFSLEVLKTTVVERIEDLLKMECLQELECDFSYVSCEEIVDLSTLNASYLRLNNCKSVVKLPERLQVFEVCWRGTIGRLRKTLESCPCLQALSFLSANSGGRFLLTLDLIKCLKDLKALNVSWDVSFKAEELMTEFGVLEAVTLWPRKRVSYFVGFQQWMHARKFDLFQDLYKKYHFC